MGAAGQRGAYAPCLLWGCGLAVGMESRAENSRQTCVQATVGIYIGPGVMCEGGLAVSAAGSLVELAVSALCCWEGKLGHTRPPRTARAEGAARPQSCAPVMVRLPGKATIHTNCDSSARP